MSKPGHFSCEAVELTYTGVDFVQEKFLGQGPQDNEVSHDTNHFDHLELTGDTVSFRASKGRADQ